MKDTLKLTGPKGDTANVTPGGPDEALFRGKGYKAEGEGEAKEEADEKKETGPKSRR